jgi:hypothetical protein
MLQRNNKTAWKMRCLIILATKEQNLCAVKEAKLKIINTSDNFRP